MRQDGGVEGLELTSSHENTKITTAEQPSTKKTGTYHIRCSTSKDKEAATTRWYRECFHDIIKSHTCQVGDMQTGK